MRLRGLFIGMIVATASSAVHAASPAGEWQVADGSARIGINVCGSRLSGVVAYEREHGLDDKNPDPAKRKRPTLGMPILLGMQATGPEVWAGQIYNAEDGKTYDARVSLISATSLQVQGCVPGTVLCGSETWTKFSDRKGGCRPGR